MASRILIPLEGGLRDEEQLMVARDLARHLDASIVLTHIEPEVTQTTTIIEPHQRLDGLAERLRAEGYTANAVVGAGRPARGIADTAIHEHADVIVMAPEHRGFLRTLREPSVTRAMLSHAPAPILVLPELAPAESVHGLLDGPGALVIVPLDGSPLAEQALPVAERFARRYGRTLLLVRVVRPVVIGGVGVEPLLLQGQMQRDEDAAARHYLTEIRQRVASETGLTVQSMEIYGEPGECLRELGATHPGSLMAMSTHGHGGLARVFLGSVSAQVARRTSIPLLIVPPAKAEPAPVGAAETSVMERAAQG